MQNLKWRLFGLAMFVIPTATAAVFKYDNIRISLAMIGYHI